jgi:hypothetical protein
MTEIGRKSMPITTTDGKKKRKWKCTITRRKLFFVSQTGMFSAQKKTIQRRQISRISWQQNKIQRFI